MTAIFEFDGKICWSDGIAFYAVDPFQGAGMYDITMVGLISTISE